MLLLHERSIVHFTVNATLTQAGFGSEYAQVVDSMFLEHIIDSWGRLGSDKVWG
jgi:hypothetical protein